MKIGYMSDLHLEFERFELPRSGFDLLILAGDTAPGERGILWLKSLELSYPVVYILGNHEYYRNAYPKLIHKLKSLAEGSNIHVLENDVFSFNGITILGCTLWTDYNLTGNQPVSEFAVSQFMNDYRLIRKSPSWSKFKTADALAAHRASCYWLEKRMINDRENVIVVTHHAPSARSIPPHLKESEINPAYASNLDEFILEYQPLAWIHGHVHTPVQYDIGDTRVLANPRGYTHQRDNGFDPGRFIGF